MSATFPVLWGSAASFYIQFDLGETHSYAGSGQTTIGGSAVSVLGFRFLSSGGVALSGSATTSFESGFYVTYSGNGTITLGGTGTYNNGENFSYQGSGGITIAGSATSVALPNYSYIGAGAVTTGGSATTTYGANYSFASTGGVTIAGSATYILTTIPHLDFSDAENSQYIVLGLL